MGRLTCWPGLPLSVYARRPRAALPFPAAEQSAQLYAFARQAVFHGVRAVGLLPGDAVLVPAYHHGSEVAALLEAGLTCQFYGRGDGVRPEASELEQLMTPRTRALYLVHALGHPQDSPTWRRWCDERGLLLLEDAAQAWSATVDGEPVGSSADLAVFCLYKTIPLPEGALVVAAADVPSAEPNRSPGTSALARRHGAWLAQRSNAVSALAERLGMTYQADPGLDLDLRLDKTGAWSTTRFLLNRLGDPEHAAVRRAHHRVLSNELGDLVPDAFSSLAQGAAPFCFPVMVPDRTAALQHLSAQGVHALDLWSQPHPSVPAGAFPAVDALRRTVVGLPVHQGLRGRDLEAITAAVRTPRRRPPVLERLPTLASAQAAWEQVAERAPHPFASFGWAQAWQRCGQAKSDPLVAVCRDDDGRPLAVYALERFTAAGLRILRFWGSPPADLAGPICAPEDAVRASFGLRALLAEVPSWDLLLAERLPGDAAWPALLGTTSASRESSPALTLPPDGWEAYLAGRSSNLRQQVRRRERRLLREHGARFRLSTPSTLDRDLEELFRLHALRWPGGTSFSCARAFHEDVARQESAAGRLRLWVMEAGGAPVAAWYGLRHAGQEWYYQAGRDPMWDRYHVGFVLLAHTIREAVADGMSAYRFLRGDEPYKARFASHDHGTRTVVLGRGALGVSVAAAAHVVGALPASSRVRLRDVTGIG